MHKLNTRLSTFILLAFIGFVACTANGMDVLGAVFGVLLALSIVVNFCLNMYIDYKMDKAEETKLLPPSAA